MKYLILATCVLLMTGCSIFKQPVPIKPEFPVAIPDLMKKCEQLKTVEGDKILITDMLKTIVENYTLYYECSAKVDGWQEWYIEQKKIYDSVK
jgi:hypothetical protein